MLGVRVAAAEDLQVASRPAMRAMEMLLEDVLHQPHMHSAVAPLFPGAPVSSLAALSPWALAAHILRTQRWLIQVAAAPVVASMPGIQQEVLAVAARSCITVDAAVTRCLSGLKRSGQPEVSQ